MHAAKRIEALGTQIEIKLPKECAELFSICSEELERIERTYSRFLASSELSKLNENLGKWQKISDEMAFLIGKGLEFKKKSKGNFDITLKGDLERLGYDSKYSFKPKSKPLRIDSLLPAVQLGKGKVLLRKQIEFGGLGKGFALDSLAKLLDKQGVKCYYLNAGGDIFVRGGPWSILLEHPDDAERAIGKVNLTNSSIAGSAPNRRRWGKNHHLLNAKTGQPQQSVKAVFVISKQGIEADAYATALFAAGFDDAQVLASSLPVEALVISANDKMFQSPGFAMEFF